MIDNRFYKIKSDPINIVELAKLIDANLENSANNDLLISSIAPLKTAAKNDLSFLINSKYSEDFNNTNASACIVPISFSTKSKTTLLKCANPYFSYSKAVNVFYAPSHSYNPQIVGSAYVAESAHIGKNCYIGHNTIIEENVIIGDDCIIESGAAIGAGVIIGDRVQIQSNSTIKYSTIGNDSIIFSGAKLGQDGFGFATNLGIHHKVFHIGRVLIGSNVEIGANTTVDRGSIEDTVIEDHCRIDNLVQIAHNVKIGKGTVVAAQTGIAGSTKIGSYCMIGGQVGFAGHLNIGDEVKIAGGSGVGSDVPNKSAIGGYPAVKIRDWHKQTIAIKNLMNK